MTSTKTTLKSESNMSDQHSVGSLSEVLQIKCMYQVIADLTDLFGSKVRIRRKLKGGIKWNKNMNKQQLVKTGDVTVIMK